MKKIIAIAVAALLVTGCKTTTSLLSDNAGQAEYKVEDCSAGPDNCITASIFNTKDIGKLNLKVDKSDGTLTLYEEGIDSSSPLTASVEALNAQMLTTQQIMMLMTEMLRRQNPVE